jgi:hypothetical protein
MIIDCDVGFKDQVQYLTKNKVDTVGRYFCSDKDKRGAYKIISPEEAGQIAQAKIRLFSIHEPSAVDLSKGQDHANAALGCAKAIGQPQNSAIYFGIEKDGGFTKADMSQITTYFQDINKTIAGKFDIGIYSNGTPCAALLKAHLVKYTYLAAASYSHDGTLDFYLSGLWTIAQVGPTDIKTWLLPSWQIGANPPQWKIDVDIANGPCGSFIANPPTLQAGL